MKKIYGALGTMLSAAMAAGLAVPVPAHAAVENGWETVDGMQYWYEDGGARATTRRTGLTVARKSMILVQMRGTGWTMYSRGQRQSARTYIRNPRRTMPGISGSGCAMTPRSIW